MDDEQIREKQVYNKLEVINPFINKKDRKKKNKFYTQMGGILLVLMNVVEVLFIGLNYTEKEHISSCLLDTCKWVGNGYNCYLNRTLFIN
jgi:hypothetical protein